MKPKTRTSKYLFVAALMLIASQGTTAGLNDTGVTSCYDASNVAVICSPAVGGETGVNPRQDGRYGRDAAAAAGVLTKVGGGAAGFDFTKIGSDGNPLAIQNQPWVYGAWPLSTIDSGNEAAGSFWPCVRDNVTGLTWEIKTSTFYMMDLPLRQTDWQYTWYDSNTLTNGGNAGAPDTGYPAGSDNCSSPTRCDTEKYVADVNATNLCGNHDWRLPSPRELLSLAHLGVQNPAIDFGYLPNTKAACYWTSLTYAAGTSSAQSVNFATSTVVSALKSSACYVRLVRGGAL